MTPTTTRYNGNHRLNHSQAGLLTVPVKPQLATRIVISQAERNPWRKRGASSQSRLQQNPNTPHAPQPVVRPRQLIQLQSKTALPDPAHHHSNSIPRRTPNHPHNPPAAKHARTTPKNNHPASQDPKQQPGPTSRSPPTPSPPAAILRQTRVLSPSAPPPASQKINPN